MPTVQLYVRCFSHTHEISIWFYRLRICCDRTCVDMIGGRHDHATTDKGFFFLFRFTLTLSIYLFICVYCAICSREIMQHVRRSKLNYEDEQKEKNASAFNCIYLNLGPTHTAQPITIIELEAKWIWREMTDTKTTANANILDVPRNRNSQRNQFLA